MYLKIDGSHGEGGGQILRTSLALSSILNKPIEIYNIRKGRPNPGLQPQHLTCVNASKEITQAEVSGNNLGSQDLKFAPKRTQGGRFLFDVAEKRGSAGAVSLVLQAIFLPLILGKQKSEITILGGTHVPWSPPFHYIEKVFLPMIRRLGCEAEITIDKWGWYPKGGGKIHANIKPVARLNPLNLTERGPLKRVWGISAISNLPESIAERQKSQALKELKNLGIKLEIITYKAPATGQGTLFFLLAEFENSVAGFSSLGKIGKPAEEVAKDACRDLIDFLNSSGAIDERLADQIIPFLALAQGVSTFTASRITHHLLTNIWVVKQFLPVKIDIDEEKCQVTITP